MRNKMLTIAVLVGVLLVAALFILKRPHRESMPPLSVAISPYQDIARIVTLHSLGLDKKYGIDVNLVTLAWEDILPALASSGRTVDVGFASYIEFLTKERDLNRGASDPLVFVYPAYVFHGGSFISFNSQVPLLDAPALQDVAQIRRFLSYRIGAPKNSLWEMMIFSLARRSGTDIKDVKVFDSPINDSLLATEKGSLDIASAGLTQMTEAKKRGGRVVLNMDAMGFADITGFVCRQSTLKTKRNEIESLLRIWFDTSAYAMSNLDEHSTVPLDYLRKNSATQYTLEQYKAALSQEYFPTSLEEAQREIGDRNGKYSREKIAEDVIEYLKSVRHVKETPEIPTFIDIH